MKRTILTTRQPGLIAGATAGLLAGGVLSAIFLAMEERSGEPSDLVRLKRRLNDVMGTPDRPEMATPTMDEQVLSHGGHLALSLVAGAVYAELKPAGLPPVVTGTLFGAGFYALAYGLVGPWLGVSPKLSDDSRASITQHGLFHVLFGVITAVTARRLAPTRRYMRIS